MEKKERRPQISFKLDEEMHKQIKVLAAIRNISLANWLKRAIIERINKEANIK